MEPLSPAAVNSHVCIELVVLGRQHHLLQVFADPRDSGQVDAVVVQTQQLVDHGLVRPLEEKQIFMYLF